MTASAGIRMGIKSCFGRPAARSAYGRAARSRIALAPVGAFQIPALKVLRSRPGLQAAPGHVLADGRDRA